VISVNYFKVMKMIYNETLMCFKFIKFIVEKRLIAKK